MFFFQDNTTRQNGAKTYYKYDAFNRMAQQWAAIDTDLFSYTSYSYDKAGNQIQQKSGIDAVALWSLPEAYITTNSTYYLNGKLSSVTDNEGRKTNYYYDANGNTVKTEQYTSTTAFITIESTYNYLGKPATVTLHVRAGDITGNDFADNTDTLLTTHYTYDKNGNLRYSTDGNGNVISASYDAMNRMLTQTQGSAADGYQTTTYTYNANGKALTATDWRGNTSTNVYDAMNRLIEQKDAYDKTVATFTYSINSQQVTATDAQGQTTTFVYDRQNRLTQTIDPAGDSTSQAYSNLGLIDSRTDGNGNTTSYVYDELNRLFIVYDDTDTHVEYQYDRNGNVISMRIIFYDPITYEEYVISETLYEYNVANQLIRSIKDGGRTGTPGSYTYDPSKVQSSTYTADGQLASRTDRNGNTTTYVYDIHGRLVLQTAVDSQTADALSIGYTYDSNGNVLTMTDGTGTTTRAYDAFNRTISKTVPYFGTSVYAYDITTGMDLGCTAQTTKDPKDNVTLKIYDRVGRLWQVTADGKTTVYTYNNNGSVQSVVYSDGSREDYTYTGDNLLDTLINTKAGGTVIDSYSYTYDSAHNMLTKTDSRGITSYTYDRLNRLVSVTEPSGKTITYTFDAAGNRKTQTVVLGTDTTITTYTYDSQNRLTGTQEQKNGVTTETVVYTYDNNGNQLTKTSTAYIAGIAQTPVIEQTNTYDFFNQLISTITSTGVTVINTYNGDGRRVGKSVNGSLTRYLYEYDKVVLEANYLGDQTGRNVYGINLLTRQVGADTFTYMYNGHADVTALLSITGLIAATYYYDAFGNILDQTGIVSNNILYAGYQYDTETGLYYLNARMYDPVTARFMQEDTYAGDRNDPLSLNLYTYCHNEPLMYSDPTGHTEYKDPGGYGTYYSNQAQAQQKEQQQHNQAKDIADTVFEQPYWPSGMPSTNYNTVSSVAKDDLFDKILVKIEYADVQIDYIVDEMDPTIAADYLTPNRDLIAEVFACTSMTDEEEDLFWDSISWLGTTYEQVWNPTKQVEADCGGFARALYEERGIYISMSDSTNAHYSSRMWLSDEISMQKYTGKSDEEWIKTRETTHSTSVGTVIYDRDSTHTTTNSFEESVFRTGDVFYYDISTKKNGVDHVGLNLGKDSKGNDIFIETAADPKYDKDGNYVPGNLQIMGPNTSYDAGYRYDDRYENVAGVVRYLTDEP